MYQLYRQTQPILYVIYQCTACFFQLGFHIRPYPIYSTVYCLLQQKCFLFKSPLNPSAFFFSSICLKELLFWSVGCVIWWSLSFFLLVLRSSLKLNQCRLKSLKVTGVILGVHFHGNMKKNWLHKRDIQDVCLQFNCWLKLCVLLHSQYFMVYLQLNHTLYSVDDVCVFEHYLISYLCHCTCIIQPVSLFFLLCS